jgi:hypothetical protein
MHYEKMISAKVPPIPYVLGGVDLLLDTWTDYIVEYDYLIDDSILSLAISQAVELYPYFSGRKVSGSDDDFHVYIGHFEGVSFNFHKVDKNYESGCADNFELHLPDKTKRRKHKFSATSLKVPLLSIKQTNYLSHTVLGLSVWHPITDGGGFFSFLTALVSAYRGETIDIYQPKNKIMSTTTDDIGDFKESIRQVSLSPGARKSENAIATVEFTFNETFLENLSLYLAPHGVPLSDYLFSLAWKNVHSSMCNYSSPQEISSLYVVYDIRQFTSIEKPLGNHLYYPRTELSSDEFNSMTPIDIAKKIRSSVFSMIEDSENIEKEFAWLDENINRKNYKNYAIRPVYESIYESSIMCNNLMHISYELFDFGQGTPVLFETPNEEYMRFISILPNDSKGLSIRFRVSLFEHELADFNKKFGDEIEAFF